jgi:polyferredoxin
MLRVHNVCAPVFHCYSCPLATFACPIGVLANFSAIHVWPLMALGTLFLVGGFVGSLLCGWVCPFGFLQDLVGRIPTPKFNLPSWTGHLRYGVLIGLVLMVPFLWGEGHPLFICRLCPAGALEGAIPNVVTQAIEGSAITWPSVAKIIILALFGIAMFVKWRPWCRLFCPLGAAYGLFNRASLVVLGFHPERCDECGACRKRCKYGVIPEKGASGSVPGCIRCLECARCGTITVTSVFERERKRSEVRGQSSETVLPNNP